MGLMDIVKKAATGATDEENQKNREKMREIFNSVVVDGQAYKLLYCKAENYTDAVLVKVTTHYSFIVGYKEAAPRTIAVVPIDASLTAAGEPRIFTKESGGVSASNMLGYCSVGDSQTGFSLVPFDYQPGVNRGSKFTLSIRQTQDEIKEFKAFFKKGL